MTITEILDRFSYHKPSEAGVATHTRLTEAFVVLAQLIEATVPDGREKALVYTNLEQAKFWASAGVARNPSTR